MAASKLSQKYQKIGDQAYNKIDKVNSELLIMTYGSLVTQLLKDYEDPEEVNIQLEKMGYKMGIRLIDEFMAKSGMDPCEDFRETAEAIAKAGFRMFLGISATVTSYVANAAAQPSVAQDGSSTPTSPSAASASQGTTPADGAASGLQSFSLVFDENPLNDFVELPDEFKTKLWYSNILCGVIRGCLEVLQMKAEVSFLKDQLRGDDMNEIRVVLKEILHPSVPDDED